MGTQSLKDNKIIKAITEIICGILLLLLMAIPAYGKFFYAAQEFWPDWLNEIFMDFHSASGKLIFLLYAFCAACLYYCYKRSYELQKIFSRRGLLLSDLELGKKQVMLKLAEQGELSAVIISTAGHAAQENSAVSYMAQEGDSSAEQEAQEGDSVAGHAAQEEDSASGDQVQDYSAAYAWTAKEKGLTIRSGDGEDTGYLLLNYQEYQGYLLPFYIGRMTTKFDVFWFLKEQDFELVWQNEKRACYKKGDWKILLAFHGIRSRVQVLELMKGEQTSLLEQTVLEAQKLSFEDQMAAAFQEFRVALKALWEEKKKRKTPQNEE